MDAALSHCNPVVPREPTGTANAMAVEVAVGASRFHSVPCKKRPFAWYKPPVSPASPTQYASPASPASLASPASPTQYASPASPASLASPASPARLVSPDSPASPGSPCSPCSSSSSSAHEDMVWTPSVAPLLWPGVPYPSPLPSTAVLHAMARSFSTSSALGPMCTAAPTSSPPASTPQPPAVRKQSDFSIEHILKDAGRASSSSSPTSTSSHPDGQFEWLNCTRYRPPKLPRNRRRDGPVQRRLGRNPRIPFSPHQVAVLEGRFRRSHYLSSADVADLSAELELSETRVKIWFQNRRARERRDGDGQGRSTVSPPQPQSSAGAAFAKGPVKAPVKAPAPSQLPRSQVSAFSAPKTSIRPCLPSP